MTKKSWLTLVVLFFAWGFVMHGSGLLLHELGGHALAAVVLACGIDGTKLTFFGHGQVSYAECERWTWTRVVIASWAGLALTTSAGFVAAVIAARHRALSPFVRLLIAQVAFFFLLGQLGYMTSGGFHDLYDPRHTSRWLGSHGLHVLAWLPPLVAYAAAAFFCARTTVDAFRAHLGSKTRLQTLAHLAATLGVAGVLYFIAFRVEWQIRTDLAMRGVAVEAERIATVKHVAPPFPIERVLLVIAIAGLGAALARPVRSPAEPSPVTRRPILVVVGATAVCFLLLLVLQ